MLVRDAKVGLIYFTTMLLVLLYVLVVAIVLDRGCVTQSRKIVFLLCIIRAIDKQSRRPCARGAHHHSDGALTLHALSPSRQSIKGMGPQKVSEYGDVYTCLSFCTLGQEVVKEGEAH